MRAGLYACPPMIEYKGYRIVVIGETYAVALLEKIGSYSMWRGFYTLEDCKHFIDRLEEE